jgi:iron complex outermembrane recepter protein
MTGSSHQGSRFLTVLADDRITNYELTIRAPDGKEMVVSSDQDRREEQRREQQAHNGGLIESSMGAMLTAVAVALLTILPTEALAQVRDATPKTDLTELTPEQLANLEVTSVSKKPEKRWATAAAIYVITREDIRHAGATSLVDALRLAPGLQIARINSSQWAVGIRGFASRLSRSMLVLIDGRSVYTPLFAGTYWEVQDVLLEDVERIEVIRGPGGTLWGANAVTGVINIITRASRDTQGTFATAGGGTLENGFAGVRYGGASGDRLSYRVYGKAFDRGPEFHSTNDDFDGWHMFQGGFRADWEKATSDTATLQGALYGGRAGQRTSITNLSPPSVSVVEADSDLSGANLLARWQHVSAGGAQWSAGAYYDRTNRRDPTFREVRNTADLDVQRRASHGRHDLIVGLGYRVSSGATSAVPTIAFLPPDRTDHLWTGFVTDAVTLAGNLLVLDAGVKLEHNDYSGFEAQPTLRLLWTPSPRHSLWISGARAVRTPSRVEHDLLAYTLIDPRTPIFARILGSKDFRSEKTLTGELGYRVQPHARLTVDSVAFYNDHDGLLSVEPGPPFRETSPPPPRLVVPLRLANGIEGSSYGAEITADWSPFGGWRLGGSYSFLRLSLRPSPGSLDTSTAASTNGTAPRHTGLVRSHLNLGRKANFDFTARFVGALPALKISSYVGLDARLAWRPAAKLEIAIVGQNLANARHAEFASGGVVTELRRGAYGELSWRP